MPARRAQRQGSAQTSTLLISPAAGPASPALLRKPGKERLGRETALRSPYSQIRTHIYSGGVTLPP